MPEGEIRGLAEAESEPATRRSLVEGIFSMYFLQIPLKKRGHQFGSSSRDVCGSGVNNELRPEDEPRRRIRFVPRRGRPRPRREAMMRHEGRDAIGAPGLEFQLAEGRSLPRRLRP